MKPLLTCLLLITSLALQAKPLPLQFDTKVKADATARVTLPREIPEPEYVWVWVWRPRLLPAEEVLLTDGAKVELDNSNQQSDYGWKPFDELNSSKLSGLEKVEKQLKPNQAYMLIYCNAIHINNHVTLVDGEKSFMLTHLEKDILNHGLELDEKIVLKDLSRENKKVVFKKMQDYLNSIDFLNLTCNEDTTMHMLLGKRTFIEYMAMDSNTITFYRFFLSGYFTYNILTDKFNIGGKEQYYMEWLDNQIEHNPDKLKPHRIDSLKKNRELIFTRYPQLRTEATEK